MNSTRREMVVSALNTIVQEDMNTREALIEWLSNRSLRDLRSIADINGYDAEEMTESEAIAAIVDCKGFNE